MLLLASLLVAQSASNPPFVSGRLSPASTITHTVRRRSGVLQSAMHPGSDTMASSTKKTYGAITVMHRPCSTIGATIANFVGVLGTAWPITIYHTDSAEASVKANKVVAAHAGTGHVSFIPTRDLGDFAELPHGNIESYSRLLTAPAFWNSVSVDVVLVFQTDSVLCSQSPFSIADFVQYAFIGAPWAIKSNVHPNFHSGNGGLSLRSVEAMRRIATTKAYVPGTAEDFFFVNALVEARQRGEHVLLPSLTSAAHFSFESGDLPANMSFGVHRWKGLPLETRAIIERKCPEAVLGAWGSCGRSEATAGASTPPFAAVGSLG